MIIKYYDNTIEEEQSVDLDDYRIFIPNDRIAFIKGMLAAKCMIVDIR